MLGIARLCRSPAIQFKHILSKTPRNVLSNNIRLHSKDVFQRPSSLVNRVKAMKFLRGTGTMAIRLSSDVSSKGKKAVGYWLLTCSGMVFVAVVLGITFVYYIILLSVFIVLEEVIKKTVR